nr:MAG TPA: hypothetical protein [Caudoviricetes sp.]
MFIGGSMRTIGIVEDEKAKPKDGEKKPKNGDEKPKDGEKE